MTGNILHYCGRSGISYFRAAKFLLIDPQKVIQRHQIITKVSTILPDKVQHE